MKKVILVVGIILTSGIAAWSLNRKAESVKEVAQVKVERPTNTTPFGNAKSDIANAD